MQVSQSTAAGAAAGSEGFQEAVFPKLKNASEEREWVANAVTVWLDQEWTPLEAHKTLGQAAGEVGWALCARLQILRMIISDKIRNEFLPSNLSHISSYVPWTGQREKAAEF